MEDNIEINKIVRKYIKDNNLVVYGGMAINEVLKLKGDCIYERDAIPDYDALSPENHRQSMELANILYEQGYQYINRVMALHEYSFRVFVNLSPDSVADLSYVPASVLRHIPYFEIDDIRYISPEYMRIDFYKSFIDVNNLYRWKEKKEYERFIKLELAYPIQKYELNSANANASGNATHKLHAIFKRHNPIFTGIHTYNKMMQFMSNTNALIPLKCIDIYYHNPSVIIEDVQNNTDYKIVERYPLIDHLPRSYVIIDNNSGNIVGNVYDTNSIYIPNVPVIMIGDERHGTYHFLLLYLYINLLKFRILGDEKMLKLTYYMIYEIQTKRDTYLNANSLTGLEIGEEKGSIINIFNLDFENPPLSFREKILIRRQFEESQGYGYKPNKGVKINGTATEFKYPKIDYSIVIVAAANKNTTKNANKNAANKNKNVKTGGDKECKMPLDITKRDEIIIKYINRLAEYITEKSRTKYINYFNDKLRPFIETFIKKHNLIITNNIFLTYYDTTYKIPEKEYFFEVYGNQQVKEYAKEFMDDLLELDTKILHYEIAQVDKYRFNLNLNFRTILSIIKLRDDVFDNMPTMKYKDIRILSIDLIRLNIYNIFTTIGYKYPIEFGSSASGTNPMQEVEKWKAMQDIEEEIDKIFPIEKVICKTSGSKKHGNNDYNKVLNLLKKGDAIIIGDKAINILAKKNIVSDKYLSILSEKPMELIEKMENVKYEQKTSYLKLYKKKYIIKSSKQDEKIAEIYDSSELCIPYFKNEGYLIGTYYTVMKYLYIELYEKKFKQCNEIKERIYLLSKSKQQLQQQQVLSEKCLGEQRDEVREFKLRKYLGVDPKTGKAFRLAKYA